MGHRMMVEPSLRHRLIPSFVSLEIIVRDPLEEREREIGYNNYLLIRLIGINLIQYSNNF